jgi:hypothetical protein
VQVAPQAATQQQRLVSQAHRQEVEKLRKVFRSERAKIGLKMSFGIQARISLLIMAVGRPKMLLGNPGARHRPITHSLDKLHSSDKVDHTCCDWLRYFSQISIY